VVPPTLAQFALVCKVLILALLPCCTGSSFLLLHAAKSNTAPASNHFDVVIIPLLNPGLRCVKSPLLIYPSSFKPQRCYLHSLTPVTYSSKRLGMSELVA
jgi:hypothetical protein